MARTRSIGSRDERGASLGVLVAVVMVALFLVAGLVVDGGARVRAHRHAEVAAARAVRSGVDATAASRLVGRSGTEQGLAAARRALADDGVAGEVSMADGVLTVTTHEVVRTTFLELVGIDELSATGEASGELRAV